MCKYGIDINEFVVDAILQMETANIKLIHDHLEQLYEFGVHCSVKPSQVFESITSTVARYGKRVPVWPVMPVVDITLKEARVALDMKSSSVRQLKQKKTIEEASDCASTVAPSTSVRVSESEASTGNPELIQLVDSQPKIEYTSTRSESCEPKAEFFKGSKFVDWSVPRNKFIDRDHGSRMNLINPRQKEDSRESMSHNHGKNIVDLQVNNQSENIKDNHREAQVYKNTPVNINTQKACERLKDLLSSDPQLSEVLSIILSQKQQNSSSPQRQTNNHSIYPQSRRDESNYTNNRSSHMQNSQSVNTMFGVQRSNQSEGNRFQNKKSMEPRSDRNSDSVRLFITKIGHHVTHAELLQYFSQYGVIRDLYMPANKDRDQRRLQKPIAFLNYSDDKDALKVLAIPHHTVGGRVIVVERALPKENEGIHRVRGRALDACSKVHGWKLSVKCSEGPIPEVMLRAFYARYGEVLTVEVDQYGSQTVEFREKHQLIKASSEKTAYIENNIVKAEIYGVAVEDPQNGRSN